MRTGFPLAMAGQRIGLLGGSFDPAHEGHVALSHAALRRFGLDRVWWLVSPGNPLKAHAPAALDARIAAARRRLRDPRIIITDIEARLGTRLTADTLAALRRHYPGTRFVWLMGSDNLVQFVQWERWREIAAMVPIGVVARPGSRLAARNAAAARILARWRLPEGRIRALAQTPAPAWAFVNMPLVSTSSSALRAGRGRDAAPGPSAPGPSVPAASPAPPADMRVPCEAGLQR